MKYKYLLLLLLMLPFVSGCNDSDDVNGIFTGKVWKLTYITKKNEHKPYDFWGDKDKYEQSVYCLFVGTTVVIKVCANLSVKLITKVLFLSKTAYCHYQASR